MDNNSHLVARLLEIERKIARSQKHIDEQHLRLQHLSEAGHECGKLEETLRLWEDIQRSYLSTRERVALEILHTR
jgi:hypothetical protein